MSLRHLPADRVQFAGSAQFPAQSAPVIVSTYGSMPEVPPSNVVVRAARLAESPSGKGSLQVTKSGLISAGTLVLSLLCFLPCWDAVQMLRNFNFVQWIGSTLPTCIFVVCAVLIIFFVAMADGIFNKRQAATMQGVALLCSLFVTMAGLTLIVASLPLSHETVEVANELAYDCAGYRARSIAIAYQNLAALRSGTECAAMESVEVCDGYTESPEALYLKQMEQHFRCSGFCARSAGVTAAGAATPALAPVDNTDVDGVVDAAAASAGEDASLLLTNGRLLRRVADKTTDQAIAKEPVLAREPQALLAADAQVWQQPGAPPTLFTQANFQTTCDGAASRDLLNFGREVGWQSWYTGIVLISISILISIAEWSGQVAAGVRTL